MFSIIWVIISWIHMYGKCGQFARSDVGGSSGAVFIESRDFCRKSHVCIHMQVTDKQQVEDTSSSEEWAVSPCVSSGSRTQSNLYDFTSFFMSWRRWLNDVTAKGRWNHLSLCCFVCHQISWGNVGWLLIQPAAISDSITDRVNERTRVVVRCCR